ncbi:MAG: lipoate--protein ligase family protein [Pseudanabaena sp. M158S2SP1A06QC]|jgi:lipoate-protein ligase A|nr:lipoate--protein ligase family protein [Pseudanabaena sp. M53BS1SP1A06MG]MCA6582394.1 lipoate--protein ligase family protein [Pseudanabaena sp. M34BS1SP1A06MG]MCA6586770.1 lipoate--protein ligase family protein [Pseudanabaena sp. M051S1SP1A06QC]MCA6592922.1 lipoate--protein ligase family protein [Pseudanabaena sp. M38BS1SP1A06MG]MCA6597251.1 lipoate--protein ligase family protein [Pseudanabaena sp. M046S1SP1A06QC]MCA6602183.1 lipoate--protein ligase family protein [Pseudanabaena sp. M57BS1S
MALDNDLLDRHSNNPQTPSILRFYQWTPAAISLGFHQQKYPDRWHEIAQQHQLDIVRRPSGGRAVLHKGDLTYAVITNVELDGKKRSHREIYEYICEFLITGFAQLGIPITYGQSGRGYIHNPSCFSTATNADLIIADGRKLVGSAQVYRRNSVLQHGSIAIAPDHHILTELFQTKVPIVGCEELLQNQHQNLSAELIRSLTAAARQHFQSEFL